MGSCSNAFSTVDAQAEATTVIWLQLFFSSHPRRWRNNYARHLQSLLLVLGESQWDNVAARWHRQAVLQEQVTSSRASHPCPQCHTTRSCCAPWQHGGVTLAPAPSSPHTRGAPWWESCCPPSHDAIACGVSPHPVDDDSCGRAEHQGRHDEDGGQDDKNDDPDVQDVLGEGRGTSRAREIHPKRETQSNDGAVEPKASSGRPRPASAMCSSQSKQALAKAPSRRRGIYIVL